MLKIEILLGNIQYGDIAEKLLPKVIENVSKKENSGRLAKILDEIKNMSGKLAKGVLNSLSDAVKEEILVYFIEKYRPTIITSVNQLAKDNEIQVEVKNINITRANSDVR